METSKLPTIQFLGYNCKVTFGKYRNNNNSKIDRIAIMLIDAETKEPIADATSNLPTFPLKPYEVLIKNYSENEGILQALIDGGILKDTGITISTGFVKLNLCNLLVEPEFNED